MKSYDNSGQMNVYFPIFSIRIGGVTIIICVWIYMKMCFYAVLENKIFDLEAATEIFIETN